MTLRSILFLIYFFSAIIAHSQTKSEWYSLNRIAEIDFQTSNGYNEKDTSLTFYPNLRKFPVFFTNELYAKDGSVMIGCSTKPFEHMKKAIGAAKLVNQVFDPNREYLTTIKNFTLSDSSLVQRFSRKTIKKQYGADDAGLFTLIFDNKSFTKFAFCKVFFMHKKDKGYVMLFFFYDDEEKLSKSIKETTGKIRFSK